ncbi:RVT_3 domain-containing protein [Cephalotus follicularis]|uniref:RVT_3 domain-containing protein n=1 Tax=Cephalotus follicularis TaxID=3775 RepID=A0A1Q3CPA3_CEPFO|nr:RVT_3 domain-containing protein [Cephalotus follicularis]
MPFSFTLTKSCSNNVVEYQALLLGIEMALDMGLSQLEIYGDSQLVINQLLKEYGVYKPYLDLYFRYATKLIEQLDEVFIKFMPRNENRDVDALANLYVVLTQPHNQITKVVVCKNWAYTPIYKKKTYIQKERNQLRLSH